MYIAMRLINEKIT